MFFLFTRNVTNVKKVSCLHAKLLLKDDSSDYLSHTQLFKMSFHFRIAGVRAKGFGKLECYGRWPFCSTCSIRKYGSCKWKSHCISSEGFFPRNQWNFFRRRTNKVPASTKPWICWCGKLKCNGKKPVAFRLQLLMFCFCFMCLCLFLFLFLWLSMRITGIVFVFIFKSVFPFMTFAKMIFVRNT